MKKLAILIVVASFGLSSIATADIVRVEYTGTVNSVVGNGFGYSFGDTITGWFEYDTDDVINYGNGSFYGFDVDSNTGDGGYDVNLDYVNECDPADCGYYYFTAQDGTEDSSNYFNYLYDADGNEIGYEGSYTGFVHYFYDDQFYDDQFGGISDLSYDYYQFYDGDYGQEIYYYNAVFFEVTSYSFSVPEPGSLALLGLGLIGMGVARRRRKD